MWSVNGVPRINSLRVNSILKGLVAYLTSTKCFYASTSSLSNFEPPSLAYCIIEKIKKHKKTALAGKKHHYSPPSEIGLEKIPILRHETCTQNAYASRALQFFFNAVFFFRCVDCFKKRCSVNSEKNQKHVCTYYIHCMQIYVRRIITMTRKIREWPLEMPWSHDTIILQ